MLLSAPTASRALLLGTVLFAAAPGAASAATEDPLFRDLSIDAAMDRARQENKLLMVFWTVDWEPECRRLAGTTWRDEKVQEWCLERAVAIEVDAEKDPTLAARFNVKNYPTVLFVRPDGQEAARMTGYFAPDEFLTMAEVELEGREKGSSKPEGERAQDPMAWIAYGNSIFRDPRQASEACMAYLWALDNGEAHQPGFRAQYFEFLVRRIASLKSKTEIARGALLDRRNQVARAMVEATAGDEAPGELVTLNFWSRRPTNSLFVYDQLAGLGERQEELRAILYDEIIEDLAAHRRYDDILAGAGDPVARVQRLGSEFAAASAASEKGTEEGAVPDPTRVAEAQDARNRFVTQAMCVYEALLATGRGADASAVLDTVIAHVPTGQVFAQAMQRASRLELWTLVDELAEHGRVVLADDEAGLDRLDTAYRNHASPERRRELAPPRADAPTSQREMQRRLRQLGKKRANRDADGDDGDDGDGDEGDDGDGAGG